MPQLSASAQRNASLTSLIAIQIAHTMATGSVTAASPTLERTVHISGYSFCLVWFKRPGRCVRLQWDMLARGIDTGAVRQERGPVRIRDSSRARDARRAAAKSREKESERLTARPADVPSRP